MEGHQRRRKTNGEILQHDPQEVGCAPPPTQASTLIDCFSLLAFSPGPARYPASSEELICTFCILFVRCLFSASHAYRVLCLALD